MGSLIPRGILDAPLSRGRTRRKASRSRKLTPARSRITLVTRELIKCAVLSGALVIAACTGFSQAQERAGASYGRWGFDESGIEPGANPGDSFFDFANGAWDARTA